MPEKAILYDATRCTACRGCQAACKQWNERDGEATTNWGSYENPRDLSTQTWVKLEFREVSKADGTLDWIFTRRSCMHCSQAACVEVCPTEALYNHPLGFVSYDRDKCTGCGYCAEFCPFSVPRLDTNRATGMGRMDKCTFCTTKGLDHISIDQEPACVKTCPTDALILGDRDELIAEGRARMVVLKAAGRPNATLYGEKELGGLHVMYVLADSAQVYGLPEKPEFPPVAIAWKRIIQPVGWAAFGAVIAGLLLNFIVARARTREEETKDATRG